MVLYGMKREFIKMPTTCDERVGTSKTQWVGNTLDIKFMYGYMIVLYLFNK